MLDRVAEPLMAGIHLGDAERLSMSATFPRFVDMEQQRGSLIHSMRAPQSAGGSSSGGGITFTSLAGGMTELVDALQRSLTGRITIRNRTAVRQIEPSESRTPGGKYRIRVHDKVSGTGEDLDADIVILAIPADQAAEILDPAFAETAATLRTFRSLSSLTVSLAFRNTGRLPSIRGTGFVVPRKEGYAIRGCSWSSMKFSGRAPEGAFLLRAFLGEDAGPQILEASDDVVLSLVLSELETILGLRAKPSFAQVFRFPRGTPQYEVGHAEKIRRLKQLERPGLYLTGGSYHGVGIPNCVEDARRTAERILASHSATTAAETTKIRPAPYFRIRMQTTVRKQV
jgi:oxygen-dependent protoporphyrinogen oxidase